jgi:CDP-ribitol ribitolphosphotransferase
MTKTKTFAKIISVLMGMLYFFIKMRKTQNKISFISRQSDKPSIDFRYLVNELRNSYPQYKVEVHCKMLPDGVFRKIGYIPEIIRQMKALASSRVVIIDGYCITVSMLHHKKDVKIIQLWHALGAFKKFGKSTVGKAGGREPSTAEAFKMHDNYDYIAASGDECVPHFAEAFGQSESKFIPIGLPRMDYLTDPEEDKRISEKIYAKYPQLDNGKKNILYVPTFRDSGEDRDMLFYATEDLVKYVNYDQCNLIVKHHVVDKNKEQVYTDSRINMDEGDSFTGMEFLSVADYVVTDYSSMIYDALLKNLPLYILCFDSVKYITERGFYIDFWRDIPALYSRSSKGICKFVAEHRLPDSDKLDAFKTAYVNKRFDSITKVWCVIIDELARGVYDERYNYHNINKLTEASDKIPEDEEAEDISENLNDEASPEITDEKTEDTKDEL